MRFLEKLAKEILEYKNEDLRDLIVILPNVRARLFLNNYLGKYAGRAIYIPVTYSSSEFMEKLSGLRSAEDFHLLSRLFEAYPQEEDLSFEEFMQWGNSVLQDFKEIDHQLIDTDTMFTLLQDIRNIEFWNPTDGELSEFQKKYLAFCKKLKSIYSDFCNKMKDDGLAHQGFMERRALEELSELELNPKSKFIIAGFNALTKAEEDIFKEISERFESRFYWDYDKYYLDNNLHEAGFFARQNKQKFHSAFNWISEHFAEEKEITIYNCSTSYEQSYVVHEILKRIPDSDQMSTAVILPDESMLIPVLQVIPPNITDINVTMGYPLSHSPYYAMFEDLLQMIFTARQNQGKETFYYKDVFRILNSEGIKELLSSEANSDIQKYMNGLLMNNRVYIEQNELNEILSTAFRYKTVMLTSKQSYQEIMTSFKDIIFNLDKKALEENQEEKKINREFLLHHFEVITQVQEMITKLGEDADSKTISRIWRHYNRLSKVQFTGEPLKGLQIMGLLESRNLDFDRVVILNVNEGTLPADKRYGSLLPNDLKLKNGMHLHREKDAVVAYHFYRVIQRAKKIDLLYSSQTENMGGGEKSRFLVQLEKELPEYSEHVKIQNLTAMSSLPIASPRTHVIERSPFVKELIKKKFSTGLSPTSISNFIRCPKDFYFLELAGLKYQEEMVESLEANVLGSAIHSTLELLYKPLVGKVLQPGDIKDMKKALPGILEKAFSEQMDLQYLLTGRNLLDYHMAEKILLRFLEKETIYVSNNDIELLALETRVEKEYQLEVNGESIPLRIKGFVDRIERKNGIVHLVDYKTGKIENRDLSIKELEQSLDGKEKVLQLLIYAMLYAENEDKILSSVGPLKRYDADYLPVKIGGEEELSTLILKDFEKVLLVYIKGIFESQDAFAHNEKSIYCKFC